MKTKSTDVTLIDGVRVRIDGGGGFCVPQTPKPPS